MWHTALPSANEAGPEKLTAQFRRGTSDWILPQKPIKLGDFLGEVAEGEETPVQCPWRPRGNVGCIACTTEEDYSLTNLWLLTWIWVSIHPLNYWLRDAVEEAETARCHQQLLNSAANDMAQTVHEPTRPQVEHFRPH